MWQSIQPGALMQPSLQQFSLPQMTQPGLIGGNRNLGSAGIPSSSASKSLPFIQPAGQAGAIDRSVSDSSLAHSSSQRGTSSGDNSTSVEDSRLSGRSAIALYMSCDDESLSEYQCLVRKNIELFEATQVDIESNAQGRNKAIVLGQVGIRCRHCTFLPPKNRSRGAMYYPAKLDGLYQAAQNQANGHLAQHCNHIPPNIRSELIRLKDCKSSAGGGKKYWADGVKVLGVYEDSNGLRFEKRS